MKTKGISYWEQHVERFVVGLALLVCLVLVAMQFLGEPNAVDIAGKSYSPGTVDASLQTKAEDVQRELDRTSAPDFGKAAEPVLPHFTDRMKTPVVPAQRLAVSSPHLAPAVGPPIDRDRPFVVPKVPQPTAVTVEQHFDTIDPKVVEENAELKAALAMAAPYDKTWYTIGSQFDVASLLKQYSEPGPNNEAPLVPAWTQGRVYFIDLKVEREEYVDGKWINHTLLDPLPGMFTFRKELKDKIDDTKRNEVLASAGDPAIRAQIIQPPFYDTLNDSWVPPGGKKAAAIAADDPAGDLKQQRAEKQKLLERVKTQLKQRNCGEAPPQPKEKTPKPATPAPKQPAPSGGGGAAPPGGDIGASGQGNSSGGLRKPEGGGDVAKEAQCAGLWKTRQKLEEAITKLDAAIEKITGEKAAKPAEVAEVKDEPETIIDIWAHDISITPGRTYRYRMTVEVYNPLFGRKIELIPAQQPLAEQFTLASEATPWTDAVTAQPPLRLFVTQAHQPTGSPLEAISLGTASAEVYRFHNGRWWLQSFLLQPGDRVGEPKSSGTATVDYGTDWFLLDVVPNPGSSKQDEEGGFAAMVMLQSLSDPSKVEWHAPHDDAFSLERRDLSGKVKLADMSSETVATGTPPNGPPKPSQPSGKPGAGSPPRSGTSSKH